MDPEECLRTVYRLKSFRGNQKAVIDAALDAKDCLVLMPTGGGKSLCFQIPALGQSGITLVVSPLLALIQNQVDALHAKGVQAASLNSSVSQEKKEEIYEQLRSKEPTIKLLYVTPELLATTHFRELLCSLRPKLRRLVIDEAHCISEWGHDFRPDYLKLSFFKKRFPDLPLMALTATATEKVRADIIRVLHLPPPPKLQVFLTSFNRANLFYEVRIKDMDDPYENVIEFLQKINKNRKKRIDTSVCGNEPESISGIVYCHTRKSCDELAQRLRTKALSAAAYHAGLSTKDRSEILERWISSSPESKSERSKRIDIIVATVAFGMGIDKADVRFVVHVDLPKSMEGYYQESGRAGRDGEIARCILYYSREDRDKMTYLMKQAKDNAKKRKIDSNGKATASLQDKAGEWGSFDALVQYCENTKRCRHLDLIRYFGEEIPTDAQLCAALCPGKRCDICKDPTNVRAQVRKLESGSTRSSSSTVPRTANSAMMYGRTDSDVALGRYAGHGGEMNLVDSDNESERYRSRNESDDNQDSASENGNGKRNARDEREYLFGKRKPKKASTRNEDIASSAHGLQPPRRPVAGLTSTDRDACYITLLKAVTTALMDVSANRFWGEVEVTDEIKRRISTTIATSIELLCLNMSPSSNIYRSLLSARIRHFRSPYDPTLISESWAVAVEKKGQENIRRE